jgi:hypothetical protein
VDRLISRSNRSPPSARSLELVGVDGGVQRTVIFVVTMLFVMCEGGKGFSSCCVYYSIVVLIEVSQQRLVLKQDLA